MGKPTGFMEYSRELPADREPLERINDWNEFHLHMEEHRVLMRNGKSVDPGHPDDTSREDVIALDPGESVIIGRYFRDFVGPYVGHCHNLAHEDHAMMFGWEIVP